MKKILILVLLSLSVFAFAQQPSPELLKQHDKFSDVKLFEAKSIYRNRAENVKLIADYEKSPTSFKDNQLFPIAICYLSVRDFAKAKLALEKFLKTNPKNITVLRTLGSVDFMTRNLDECIKVYKQAIALGDEYSAIFCCSALLLSGKTKEIKEFLPIIEKFARKNLESLNILMAYVFESRSAETEKILSKTFKEMDVRKVILSANPESLRFSLRLYMAKRDVWPARNIVIPARAAALLEQWTIALDCYKKALNENPNDSIALRGMGLVQYRLGDITTAANSIKKAYDNGDKDAAVDGIELFLLSKYRFVWDMFKDKVDVSKMSLDVRAGLVQYASEQKDCADMFFNALKQKDSDILFTDTKVRSLVRVGLDKYATDSRAKDIAKRLYNAVEKK